MFVGKPSSMRVILGSIIALLALSTGVKASDTVRRDAAWVLQKIDADQAKKANKVFDPEWKEVVFSKYEFKGGKLMYAGTDGKLGTADDWSPAYVDITTSPGGGDAPGAVIQTVPVPIPGALIGGTMIFPFVNGFGEIQQDGNGNFWYLLPGSGTYAMLTPAMLKDAKVRALFEKAGFTVKDNGDGTFTLIDTRNLSGRGANATILVGIPGGGGAGGAGGAQVLVPGGMFPGGGFYPFPGGAGAAGGAGGIGIFQIPGAGSAGAGGTGGAQGQFQFPNGMGGMGGTIGFFPGTQVAIPNGYWNYTFNGPNGAQLMIYDSAGKMIDPKKFEDTKREFKIGNVTYVIQEIDNGFFDWDDEWVILRKGNYGEYYLIDKAEHAFIMGIMRADRNAYGDILHDLDKTDTNEWDQGDYDNVIKNARLYPHLPYPQASQFISYGSYGAGAFNGFFGGGGAGMSGGGGMASMGVMGGLNQSGIDAFIQQYLAQNPNATIEQLQAALNEKYGNNAILITGMPNGGYQYRFGPNGANGAGSMIAIYGQPGAASGASMQVPSFQGMPGMNGMNGMNAMFMTNGGGGNAIASVTSAADAAIARIKAMGSSSSSSSSGAAGTTSSNSNPGAAGSTGSTYGMTWSGPRVELKETINGWAIKIPNGNDYVYIDLDPSDYTVKPDGTIVVTNTALIDKLKAEYPGRDFSVLTTAPGSSSSNNNSSSSAPNKSLEDFKVSVAAAIAKINEITNSGGTTEVGGLVLIHKDKNNQPIGTSLAMFEQGIPVKDAQKVEGAYGTLLNYFDPK